MAFQSVPETAEIIIEYLGQGEKMINVLAGRFIGGYSLADVQNLASVVDAAVGTAWLDKQSEEVSYVGTTVRGLEFENDVEAFDDTSAGPGEVLQAGNSGNVTLAVKKQSGLTGRSARGRTYWIGLTDVQLQANKNRVDVATVSGIETGIEVVRLAIFTSGWLPVIVSRFSGGVARDPGETFPWISSAAVNDFVDSQRRRLS